jgi:hypothetical protein
VAGIGDIGGEECQHGIDGKPVHAVGICLAGHIHAQQVVHHRPVGHAVRGERGDDGENIVGGNARAEGAGVLAQHEQAIEVKGDAAKIRHGIGGRAHDGLGGFPGHHADGLGVVDVLPKDPVHQLAHALDWDRGIEFQVFFVRAEALGGGA